MKRIDIRQVFFTGPALLAALAACDNDHELLYLAAGARCEIVLRSGETGVTAATRDGEPAAENIPGGEAVYVWADEVTTPSPEAYGDIQGWEVDADGDGGFTSASPRYFPTNGHSLKLYALHGNFASAPSGALGSYTHTVAADQTTASPASDLLYAISDEAAPGGLTSVIPLSFSHLLAKVRVAIQADGVEATAVKLCSSVNSTLLTPSREAIASSTLQDVAGTAGDISLPVADNPDINADDLNFGECMVIPQAFAAGGQLIKVETDQGTAAYALDAALTLLSGYVYDVRLTVSSSAVERINIIARITDFGDGGGSVSGNANSYGVPMEASGTISEYIGGSSSEGHAYNPRDLNDDERMDTGTGVDNFGFDGRGTRDGEADFDNGFGANTDISDYGSEGTGTDSGTAFSNEGGGGVDAEGGIDNYADGQGSTGHAYNPRDLNDDERMDADDAVISDFGNEGTGTDSGEAAENARIDGAETGGITGFGNGGTGTGTGHALPGGFSTIGRWWIQKLTNPLKDQKK